MTLFQRPPSAPNDVTPPVVIPPEEVNRLDEGAWYDRVYRGDAPQLTLRAVLTGSALGFLLAFTNVYIGLKIGMHFGVGLSACILSFTIWEGLSRIRVARTPMSILENNCMQSTASAAGYATGVTLANAVPALLLLSVTAERPGGTHLPWPVLAAWILALAVLGTVLAIPMKRVLVNRDRLDFPSGTAAAVLLHSLHARGAEAQRKARALVVAAVAGGAIPMLKDLLVIRAIDAAGKVTSRALLPAFFKIFDAVGSIPAAGKVHKLSDWNVKLEFSGILVAAGALVGLRVALSAVIGGLFLIFFLGPAGMTAAWRSPAGDVVTAVTRPGAAWKEIGLWLGAPLLVSSGLLSFALRWRSVGRAFSGLRGGVRAEGAAKVSAVEVPNTWFVAGAIVAGTAVIAIAWRAFQIPPHLGLVAVAMTSVLALVASRVTGESDVTPSGAMGKIMQLSYGALIPQNVTANVMTAGITTSAAVASADLLTDLKSGYLLGANPRRQFIAQLIGTAPGTVATLVAYYILVPDATALTGREGEGAAFPAPGAQQWKLVAQVFKQGVGNLHPMARRCIGLGLVLGAILVLLEKALPAHKKYLPSATGIGLGLILPFHQPLSLLLGAALAAMAARWGGRAKDLVIPIASGLIVGESLSGVIAAAANTFAVQ